MGEQTIYLGWDVGGTKSAAVLGTGAGEVLERAEYPSNVAGGPEAMIGDFLARARELLGRSAGAAGGAGGAGATNAANVAGVGVSIGGPLNTRTGVIDSPPHLPGWDRVPLRERLEGELGLPVTVEHDAAACLLAEWLWGEARGATHAVYLTCGTGCGAGILVDGRVLRGPHGETPEAGHIRIAPDGPVMFGKSGSAEVFGSGEGVGKLAHAMFPDAYPAPADPRELAGAARRGDARAAAVLAESACGTGRLCAVLADLFAPQVIVLGSLARYFGAGWVATVEAEFRREALAVNARHTRILPAGLGERLQDLSAIAPCVCRNPSPPGEKMSRAKSRDR